MKPVVDRLQARYQGSADLYIYAEADKDPQAGAFASTHGINGVPTTVIVNPQGREVRRFVGPASETDVAQALDAAR
jgi:thioredoxin-like negative regulator of GroEL